MRKFFRFIDIVIVGILLTILALSVSIVDIALNKNTVKKQIDKAGIYDEINNELKSELKVELVEEIAKYPEVSVDVDELVDKTITSDVLKEETDYLLEQLYNNSDSIEFDAMILLDGYRDNLNTYLYDKGIEIPAELNQELDNIMEEGSEGKIDITEYTEDFTPYFYEYKDIAKKAIAVLSIVVLILVGLSVIISTEKLKVIYKPLILSGILLIIVRFGVTTLFSQVQIPEGNEMATNLILAIKNTVISNIDKFAIAFIVFGILVLGIKIVLNKKTNNNEL